MRHCRSCGDEPGAGRYCTHCGQPVDATAERPAVQAGERPTAPPTVPPPTAPSFRYPLYADEVAAGPARPPAAPAPAGHVGARHGSRRPPAWAVPVTLGLALVVVAALGAVLLAGSGQRGGRAAAGTGASASADPHDPGTAAGSRAGPGAGAPATPPPADGPTEVAHLVDVTVPETAPPSEDLDGNQIRYEARHMLDGMPSTCWRMGGDASGEEIVFALAGPTELTRVGLVNGYAKTDAATGSDWYAGNRRLLVVEWVFDDGTTVRQELDETRGMQTIALKGVVAEEVRLRLVSVSAPGKGRTGRDYTAISDVSIVGQPT